MLKSGGEEGGLNRSDTNAKVRRGGGAGRRGGEEGGLNRSDTNAKVRRGGGAGRRGGEEGGLNRSDTNAKVRRYHGPTEADTQANNNNDLISIALFHVKHAQLR